MELWWGVPLLVLSMEYDTPELWIIIAERSTGLVLCKDTISWRSGYTRESTTYHVMEICNKHSSKMALNFETEDAAADFSLNVSLFLSKLENMNVCPAKCCVNKWLENSSEEDKRCTPCCLFQLLIMSEEDYYRYLAYHRYFEPRVLNRGGFGGDW
ncbi:uncharacterized protein LOC128999181 [Macrosteles quadrilineatus]|uniref:uncharacterized protein LOC128999181 n=1 Tax=Macrosteles quadrilineatus TaxID=74068 RepID=UPI0023E26B0C|nr:uncharacterized protein LOC128999181 [Macrosteles quadrilineatus]